ncbi:50S ribosomal protein L5 [Candidatus Shapirobacteria bacterium]|nr:50S ribosomal protein L5 [Candidatus Shapirobacteria bacterium]
MSSFLDKYEKEIKPRLAAEFSLKNSLAVPRILKIVVNQGAKEMAKDKALLEKLAGDLAAIAGQKPSVRRAKKSISEFKLVKGEPIGLMATLRGKGMYDFLERLVKIVLPRVRDFRGVLPENLDEKGNFNLGVREQIVFPEIDYAKIGKPMGLQITVVISGNDKERAKRLLEEFGMPFAKK